MYSQRTLRFLLGPLLLLAVMRVPAAVWLFGSALGMLGWMRRNAL